MTTTLYLIRHGATGHNLLVPPRMQGRGIDEPLAPEGRLQARAVAGLLRDRPLAAIYTSPLRRALETATTLAEPHGKTPIEVAGLVEVDLGRWENRSWDDIEQNDPEVYAAFRRDPEAQGYPGGENLAEVARRVVGAIDRIVRDHPGEEIAVVAHSVLNRVYLGEILGVPLALRRRLPQDNCGVTTIRCRGQKRAISTINAVAHLPC